MDLEINPLTKSLNGEITAPGSKSYSHRAFIAASLAEGISIIKKPLITGDVGTTLNLLRELNVKVLRVDENSYIVEHTSKSFKEIKKPLDCRNSGTTARIFAALSLLIKGGLTLTGNFFDLERPILPLLEALKNMGAEFKLSKKKLHITALLMICPLLMCKDNDIIQIELTSPLVSKPFVKITLDVLNAFGIYVQENLEENKFFVTNKQIYRAQSYVIPGDFSSSAFIIGAAVLSKQPTEVIVSNLSLKNSQGDQKIIEILKNMGASLKFSEDKNRLIIRGDLGNYPLRGLEIDCHDIPDLFPILSVIGSFARGKTVLYNARNLRLKESDRISSMARELRKMGVNIQEEEDKLTIFHCDQLSGAVLDHSSDHRVAMACTVAALYSSSNSQMKNIDIVQDSYPTFLDDLQKLGAHINVFQ
ncbi:MAG: 3-phosphoshikimate 1-carboxyvinyltransferase [Promethearchaeota archaeon]|jgi:3-phosphoshikimate 1-carboxyvinyltransferase